MTVKYNFFQGKQAAKETETVSLTVIRQSVKSRLDDAHRRLDPRVIFQRQARKNSNDDGLLGSIIINSLCGGAITAAFGGSFDLPDFVGDIDDGALSMVFEAATTLSDVRSDEAAGRRNKIDLYPEGRRRDPLMALKPKNTFNLVSGNDNARYENDAHAEIYAMSNMLQMIDKLERKEKKNVQLTPGTTVYQSLRAA